MRQESPETSSRRLAAVGSRDTAPELVVRRMLHGMGLRFRLHRRDLPGSPDVVLPKHRTVVFVHGCYWHRHAQCPYSQVPARNSEFWQAKFRRNVERDIENQRELRRLGWRVVTVWECETRNLARLERRLRRLFTVDTSSELRMATAAVGPPIYMVRRRMENNPKLRSYEGRNIEWVDTSQVEVGATHRVVDLFAGAGGLSLGFSVAGYESVLAVECEVGAAATYAANFPGTRLHTGLIEDLGEDALLKHFADGRPDVVCGGPPCQSHSTAGRRDAADPRGHLYQEFLRVVAVLRAHFLVMENVPGLLSIEHGARVQRILDGLVGIGYPDASVMMLEAAEFGVPQMRKRLFIIANRHGLPNPRPLPLLSRSRFISVEASIDDLKGRPRNPATNHEWTRHTPEMEQRLARVAPGATLYDGYSGSWRRLRIGLPSPTIKENHGAPHIHYELPRTISAREMARLQTFPDEFVFCGDMASAMIQIGNAVPALLVKAVALALRPSLDALSRSFSGGQPLPPE